MQRALLLLTLSLCGCSSDTATVSAAAQSAMAPSENSLPVNDSQASSGSSVDRYTLTGLPPGLLTLTIQS